MVKENFQQQLSEVDRLIEIQREYLNARLVEIGSKINETTKQKLEDGLKLRLQESDTAIEQSKKTYNELIKNANNIKDDRMKLRNIQTANKFLAEAFELQKHLTDQYIDKYIN